MSVALTSAEPTRTTRLTALVSGPEAERIAGNAAAAGLSVSAYLRDRALGQSDKSDQGAEVAALRQLDALIERMETDLDSAISVLSATIARIDNAA